MPVNLPPSTICDMTCFYKRGHEGPHQYERRMYCELCDDYGHNKYDHNDLVLQLDKENKMQIKLASGRTVLLDDEDAPRKTIYLGGPMAGCTLEEMTGWRNELKKEWSEFDFRDPCDRNYNPQQWRQLVEDDIQDIDESDIVVCYMWKPGVGSSMELVEARYRRKPTIVVIPDFKYVSPWIRQYADFLVENFEHAYKIIKQTWPTAGVEGTHHS